jgi:hypothetical protein
LHGELAHDEDRWVNVAHQTRSPAVARDGGRRRGFRGDFPIAMITEAVSPATSPRSDKGPGRAAYAQMTAPAHEAARNFPSQRTTATGNLDRLPGVVAHQAPEVAGVVSERAAALRAAVDEAPKTPGWRMRAKVGRRRPVRRCREVAPGLEEPLAGSGLRSAQTCSRVSAAG